MGEVPFAEQTANEHAIRMALGVQGVHELDREIVTELARYMYASGSMRDAEVVSAYRLLYWKKNEKVI